MPNVRLFVFLSVCAVFKEKFIHRLRPVFFQLCYGRLHKSSPGIVRLHRALGAGWGGVGETGWKWDIRVKIDCHMKPYADKLFVVLFFSVRSSRSSAHGRHFANIPWGKELGFYSARWMRKARKMETCRGHSALTDWAGKPIGSWESFLSSLLHEGRWNMKMK